MTDGAVLLASDVGCRLTTPTGRPGGPTSNTVLTLTGQSFTFYAYLRPPEPFRRIGSITEASIPSPRARSSHAVGALAVSRKQQAVYGCSLRSSRFSLNLPTLLPPAPCCNVILLSSLATACAAVAPRRFLALPSSPYVPVSVPSSLRKRVARKRKREREGETKGGAGGVTQKGREERKEAREE